MTSAIRMMSYREIERGLETLRLNTRTLGRATKLVRLSPKRAFRLQPVTFLSLVILAIYMMWFGTTLLVEPITQARIHGFHGPELIVGIRVWGWLFLGGGLLMAARLMMFGYWRASLVLHLIDVIVCVAWAAAWFAGPLTSAQPAYTLIAVLVTGLPYINAIAQRFLVLVPRR